MFEWTRAKLHTPELGATGESDQPYGDVLVALDTYEAASKGGYDDPRLVPILREVILWCDRQLKAHPDERRNKAVETVRGAALAEIERLMALHAVQLFDQYTAQPSYWTAEAFLLVANAYMREFVAFASDDAPNQKGVIKALKTVLKAKDGLWLNTGATKEVNLTADGMYIHKPQNAVPAEINCALCTAAAVITNLSRNLTCTDALVRDLYKLSDLHPLAQEGAQKYQMDFGVIYQHSEIFKHLGYSGAQANMGAIASSTAALNTATRDGIKALMTKRGLRLRGDQSVALPIPALRDAMRSQELDGCVFAVLVGSAGHWNLARRSGNEIEFVDYQTDCPGKTGPVSGPNPQMGVDPGRQDLGEDQKATFLAFSQ